MQVWTQVKKENQPKSHKQLVKELIRENQIKKEKLGLLDFDNNFGYLTEQE